MTGSPGSGKSYFVIQHIIKQHLQKGFTMLVYDFKYDDLAKIAYNSLLKNQGAFKIEPGFYIINFEDLSRSHRCNPLDSSTMFDITDAVESSRSILVADDPDQKIKLKTFHSEILNDHEALKNEQRKYKPIPVISDVTQEMVMKNYFKIREDVAELIKAEIDILLNTLE